MSARHRKSTNTVFNDESKRLRAGDHKGHNIAHPVTLVVNEMQGQTGITFQAGKSHTHPGHPIHPQIILIPRTTLLFVWALPLPSHKKRFKSFGWGRAK